MSTISRSKNNRLFCDIAGQKFGMLTVVSRSDRKAPGKTFWNCLCDCGNTKVAHSDALRSGRTATCGCMRGQLCAQAHITHGQSGVRSKTKKEPPTVEYRTWTHLLNRCKNPKNKAFPDYGGRGIGVCDRWNGPDGFKHFYEDMGPRPGDGYTIERKDNDGPYAPENCEWILRGDQARNTRRNHFITIDGRTAILADWLRERNLPEPTYLGRIRRGWEVTKAIMTPSRPLKPR